jgi:plasmid maintenance system antidote protein VapI
MPMKNPPHPGDFIRIEVIEPAGLSVTAAAAALRVSRPALSSLLNGNSDTAMPAYCSRWGFCYFDSPRRSAPNS